MLTRTRSRVLSALVLTAALALAPVLPTVAASGPPNPTPPDSTAELSGFSRLWTPSSDTTYFIFAGTVRNEQVLQHNDEIVTWINTHATNTAGSSGQVFSALQAASLGSEPDGYNPSVTMGLGLGESLSAYYIDGLKQQILPQTVTLVDSLVGTSSTAADYETPKETYLYPRPFLHNSTVDDDPCPYPDQENSTALASIRSDTLPWVVAGEPGQLDLNYWDDDVDDTQLFTNAVVPIGPAYEENCPAGSFPSGHSTYAYEAALMLAVLVPELAPELLTRASEIAMDRLVLGVHYPLDVIGGRMIAMSGIATQLNDPAYFEAYVVPAREELRTYLEARCGNVLAACIEAQAPYSSNPFGGSEMPGGTAQIVVDRASAVAAYTERMTYGFEQIGQPGRAIDVPAGAQVLLRSVYPDLTADQRTSVLAQTAIDSGYPLAPSDDGATGSDWQRINLAAAMSATVQVNTDDSVTVLAVGGDAQVTYPSSARGPQEVIGGEPATFVFTGLQPDELAEITLRGPDADAATLATIRPTAVTTSSIRKPVDADGTVSVTVSLPFSANGAYTLTALGMSSGVTISAEFAAVSRLPATGGSPAGFVEVAAVAGLLVIGLVLVGLQRRRRA